jgi:hypothetical protein
VDRNVAEEALDQLAEELSRKLTKVRIAISQDPPSTYLDWMNLTIESIKSVCTTGLKLMDRRREDQVGLSDVFARILWGQSEPPQMEQTEPYWHALLLMTYHFLHGSVQIERYYDVLGDVLLRFAPAPNSASSPERALHLHRFLRYYAEHHIPDGTQLILNHLRTELEDQFSSKQVDFFLDMLAIQVPDQVESDLTLTILQEIATYATQPIRPFVILDKACQTGRLMLALARQFPVWALHNGFVLFYGFEKDPVFRKIAQANCLFHGIEAIILTEKELSNPDLMLIRPDLMFGPSEGDEG